MKKIALYLFFVCLCIVGSLKMVNAEDLYYIPMKNTHYYRSQHAYGFKQMIPMWTEEDPNGQQEIELEAYIPAIYTVLSDIKDVEKDETWNFHEKYTVPWTPLDDSYYVGYCAELFVDIRETEPYHKVDLKSSKLLKDEIKPSLLGIMYHSYPFITEKEMKDFLTEAGVLVKKGNFLTVKANENPTRDINLDELVAATTHAILNFSNPGQVTKMYTQTFELASRTVMRAAGLWDNTVEEGKHDEVEKNIKGVYDYLITLKGEDADLNHTLKIKKASIENNNDLVFELTDLHIIKEDVKLAIYQDDKVIKEMNLNEVKKDGNTYTVPLGVEVGETKISFTIKGSVTQQGGYVFEAVNRDETRDTVATQTLVTLGGYQVAVDDKYEFQKCIPPNIIKEVDKKLVSYGETVTYTIKVHNTGKVQLDDVKVVDNVPTELSIVDANGGQVSGNEVTWTLNLAPDEEKIFTLVTKVKDNVKQGEVINKTRVIYKESDMEAEVPITVFDNPKTGMISLTIIAVLGIGGLGIWFNSMRKSKLYRL